MRIGLRYRLLLPLAVLLLGDGLLTAWAAAVAAETAEQRVRDQLQAVARTLTEPPTFPLTPRVLEQMRGLSGAEFALQRRNGQWMGTLGDRTGIDQLASAPESSVIAIHGTDYRVMALPLRDPHPNQGETLYICYPEQLRRTAIRDAIRPTILLGLVGGLVACLLSWLASSRLVVRIRELDQRTRAIAAGDWRPLPVPRQQDEIRDLVESVNEMARRLAEYQETLAKTERLRVLGQFSGGLAHQLRNATAGATLAVQLALADAGEAEREPLEVALRQLGRIEMNLRQFLDLGRPPSLNRQACDLAVLLDQILQQHRPQAAHSRVTLHWQPAAAQPYLGDSLQLGHLFSNLIGNAIEAAGAGGEVEVTLQAGPSAGSARVEVIDTGPGPPPEIADRLFDAFVTGRDQGIGLGLAVARQAAEAHGGTLSWERREGRTVFRVVLTAN